MASFPNLRPSVRSARSESRAALAIRKPSLLIAIAILLSIAFFAVSELATLRGAKAHVGTPAFLQHALGSPDSVVSLVRTPAPGTHAPATVVRPALGGKLELTDGGLRVTSGSSVLSLRFGTSRARTWRNYENGMSRATSFGGETITFGVDRVEQSLTVDERQGTRTWRWRLGAKNVQPTLRSDGSVHLTSGGNDSGLEILPATILDRSGKDITPGGLRWSLLHDRNGRWLELRLDDAKLPVPYVIDPIALVGTCPGPFPGDYNGCSVHEVSNKADFTSSPLVRPASVVTGSLMLAQITVRNNDAITAPAGWTSIGNLRQSGAGLEQALYYRLATAADTAGTTYSWSWTNKADATGAVLAYSGVDGTSPFDVTPSDNSGNSGTATASALATTQNNDMLMAFYGAQANSTATQDAAQSLTQEYTVLSTSSAASRARGTGADGIQASPGDTGNKTATVTAATNWVAHLVALMPSLSADGSGTLTTPTTNVSASQTGNTVTFTYTAAAGGMQNGSLTLVVPSGWTAPSTTGSNAGYTTASAGTVSVSSQTITVSSLTLAGGQTLTVTYGDKSGGGPGATATGTTGAQTWQAQEKARSTGILTNLSSSPSITVNAADGSGTLTTPTSAVSASSTGRTDTFTYTAATGGISNGAVTLVVPSGWSAPSTTGSSAGYTTASTGTVSVSSQTITVSSITVAGGSTFTITYGDTGGGGPGATATSSTGAQTWQAQAKSTAGGTLTNLGSSPSITVYAADGSGTLTTGTSAVSASSTGNTITFTYTAASGGISNGSVTVVVPSGWSAPSTTNTAAGYTTSSAGTVSVSSQTITVSSLTLASGATFTITYGNKNGGTAPGATAGSSTGAQTWQAQERSVSGGTLANLGSSPSITVYAADGSGTLTTATGNVSAGQTGNTITFTYTAASGGISNGAVTLAVPSGWTAPSTTGSNAGYTTASAGTVSVSSQTITVSSLTLAGGSTVTITYGDKGSGGPGATATSSTGAQTWQAQDKSISSGTLTNLGSSPSITVNAADGSGTLTTPTSAVSASSTGNTITFTYTAASGGISNGAVTLVVPSGWSAPSTTGSATGYTTASGGTVSVSSQTITVSSLTLAGGSTFTITYGSTSGGGAGATAMSSTGAQTWQAQAKSTSAGSLTNLGSSPSVTVYAADGSGTMTTPTANVSAGQTGKTIAFTYTAAAGGTSSGTITLVVPSGWSAPSTTGANAGYSTSSAGTLSVSGQTITVSSLTLAGGATSTVTYGSTSGGGPGATATSSTGAQTWQAQERSTSGGTLTNLGSSPSITVNAADGSGTLTTPTSTVPVSSAGNTITFTYTAAAGGSSNGSVTVVVPSGWSAPSTTGANAGYTTSSAGSVSVSGQTITVSALTLAGGATATITYGDKGSGGPGATATSSAGAQTWQAQEKSTSGGALGNLGSAPSITVLAADGSGTLTTPTGSVNSASPGHTITFTYTATTGGSSNGAVTLVVPSGWSAPSTTGANAGYTTASSGAVSVSGQTITVSSLTVAGGSTFTITYGDTGSGGPGATAPVPAGAQTWQAQEKSSAGGTLTNLGSSPSITVNDTTAPSAPSLSFGSFTNASATGTTVYIRQGTAGGFTVTGTSSDTESGIDHLTFASGLGSGWTGGGADSSAPYTGVYTFGAAATAPAGNQDVTATNGWALTSSSTPFTLVADTTAPSVTAPGVTAGYYTSLSVPVTKNGGTDGGSGVDGTTSILQRDEVALSNGSCGAFPGSWSTVALVGGNDTSVVSGKCYRYRELLSDNVGNQGVSPASNTAKVDSSGPSTPTLSFSGLSGNAYYDGAGSFYFRPSASGTFTVTAASSDGQSGIGSYTFGTLNSNGGSNWSGSQSGDHVDYTFGGTTTAPSTARTVNSTNGAGTSSGNATYTIAADTTAPSVTAPGVTAGYYTSLSVPVTKNGGNDGGSGVDGTSSILERDVATLTNGSCGGFSGTWTTVTPSGGNDTSVTNGHCYEYRELLSDHVGNQGTSSTSNVAKVDAQGPANSITLSNASPAGSVYQSGATVYYRGSTVGGGSFKLTNAVTDSESGPASSGTGALGGTTTGWSHTPSTVSAPAGGPYDSNGFGWTQGTTSSPTEVVTGSDVAGNTTASTTLTFTNDSTAPSGQTITLTGANAPWYTAASVTFSVADGTDNGGGAGLDTSSRTVTRETAPLTNGSCGTFTADAGTFTSPDTAVSGGNCYRYTFVESDRVGNQSAGASAVAKVDTTDPLVSLSDPGSPVGGTITLNATASDPQSAITQVAFERAPAGSSTWTTIGTDTTAPYSAALDTTALADGLYDLRAVATNSTGATASSLVANRRVDNTAPDTSIDGTPPDPDSDQTPTFAFSSSEGGSTFQCRIDGGSWAACSSPDTLGTLAAGSHTFDVRATDPAGNTDATPASYTWTIDLSVPDTTIDASPSDPSNDANPTFQFSANQPGATFQCRTDAGSWAVCSSPDTLGTLAAGSHAFDVRAKNAAGNIDPSPASYTWTIDLTAPSVTITAPTQYVNAVDPTNYTVTASTPDGDVARVDFYECSNASSGCSTGTWNQFGTDSAAPFSAVWTTPAFDGPKAIRAVAVDQAGNSGAHVRTITIDRTPPTGVTVSYPDGYAAGAVTVTTGNGPDSDVDASSGVIERETATLANDSCGAFGGFSPVTSPDTVPSGKCAMYRYRLADDAGNIATATSANVVKSDTAAPTSAISDPGTDLRQTITLGASASDAGGAGLAAVAFERRPAGGGSWTTIASDTTSPYSISFDTTTVPDGRYDFRSVATDNGGNVESSPSPVTARRIDNTAPAATMQSPGNPVRGTVTLGSTTSDAGSGIASVSYELAPHSGAFSSQAANWDTTGVSDGLYDLRVLAADTAGNTTTSALITTRVDNTPPSLTFSSPAGGDIVSGTVAVTASATDASPASPPVTFEAKLHSAPPTAYAPLSSLWDTTGVVDGLYDVRATATDDAGNQTQVENTSIRVDNTAPTVSITAPPAAINGSFPSPTPFSANASDTGSGVAQVDFFECSDQSTDCGTGTWNSLGTVTSAPYSVSWSVPSDGSHALRAIATDNAGHTASAIRNVVIDRTPPDTTITGKPADPSNAAATFTFTSNEPGSTFECRIDGGSWNACTSPKTFTGQTDNAHTVDIRATDPAGNVDPSPASWTWHRDTTAPTGTLDDPGRNVRGTVTLTSSGSDPVSNGYASGIASVSYEYSADGTTWATIGTLTTPPLGVIDWNTTGITDAVYQLHVIVTDLAGNVTTSAAVTNVRIDNTPPTTSQDDPGPYLRGTKTISGSAADGGSGVDHVDFQVAPAGSGSWATVGTSPTSPYSASFDTTGVSDGHYDFRTIASDVAGNQAASTAVTDRLVDNTPPTATMTDPGPYVRGTIALTSTTDDPGGVNASGIASVAYEYSTDGGTTWTPTGASLDTKTLPDGNLKLHAIATDNAGNATTSPPVTTLVDNTKPATTDDAPSGWRSSDVTVHLTASDAGSGVNVTEYSVDGGPFSVGASVTIPAPADGSNDGTHTIAYFSADNAGNIEQVRGAQVLIDATPPACPSCSAADYLRGTVTLTATPTDPGAGIKSVTFEYSPAGAGTWTTIGTDSTGPAPYTTNWNTTTVADGHYDLRIVVTDNADNTTTTDLPDKVVDNTPPNVSTVGAPTEGAIVAGNVGIDASAADATSPIASVEFFVRGSSIGTDSSAPYSLTWNSASGADGSVQLYVVVTDMAGNSTQSPIRTITVDNNAPSPTLADPGQNLSGTVTLNASSDPDTVQVNFERRPAGGSTWTSMSTDTTAPFSASLDTTTLADGLYDFRVVATDGTGNTGASAIRSNVRIDNTAPAGSLTAPTAGATVGGSAVHLAASVSDGGSGVASVRYEERPTGGGSFSPITTSSTTPFDGTWDTTSIATGDYDLRPVITDRSGNSFTGATVTVHVDTTAPTVVLADPGSPLSHTVQLSATVTGTGATKVVFGVSPAGANAWQQISTDTTAPYSASFDTTTLADGAYDLRAVVSDSVGNTSSSVRPNILVDNAAPRVVSSTPADGSHVTSATSITLDASEPATPVNVTLDGASTVAPVITGTHISYGTGALSEGLHTLTGTLRDATGKTAPFLISFTIWNGSGTPPPTQGGSGSCAIPTTVTSADGFARVTVPAGACSSSTDWVVVRITPSSAAPAWNGFLPGTEVVDVTAHWALSGAAIHHFDLPLEILLRASGNQLVPATRDSGDWHVLAKVTVPPVLPAGWQDGQYTDASGSHALTLHLSQFTLLKDVQPPAPPSNVRGFLFGGGLTLSWTPGADNSGTYDFVSVLANGSTLGSFGNDRTAGDVGPYSPSDPRAITLTETDLSGNVSPETKALLPVPPLVGVTLSAAETALGNAGFTVGKVTEDGTGAAGTVTGPTDLVLAEPGAAIDLTVAPGSIGATKFVFSVVGAKGFKPAKRRTFAVRIKLTRKALVTATLYSPRGAKLYRWTRSLNAGRTILRLRLPRQVRRPGLYSIRWIARSGVDTGTRTLRVRLVRRHGSLSSPSRTAEVVLAGTALPQTLPVHGLRTQPRVLTATGVDPAFDLAGSQNGNVQVMIVDVDQFGVSFVRDLHTVFPNLRIVALSRTPRRLAAALKAGATVALPSSTPTATLSAVVAKLLKKH